jgi:hypothetical protein
VTITNNVIYKNNRAGIRVGDYVAEVSNNTLVANGSASDGMGGGIAYDNRVNVALDGQPSGTLGSPIYFKNNIIAYNVKGGMRGMGFDNSSLDRNYNLVYSNNYPSYFVATPDCTSPATWRCYIALYGGFRGNVYDPNDIFDDPLFTDRANYDYTLQVGSPGDGTASDSGDMGAWGGTGGTFNIPGQTQNYDVPMDW